MALGDDSLKSNYISRLGKDAGSESYLGYQQLFHRRKKEEEDEDEREDLGRDSVDIDVSLLKKIDPENIEEVENLVNCTVKYSSKARSKVIEKLKKLQQEGRNINDLYSSNSTASKQSLRKMLFMEYGS